MSKINAIYVSLVALVVAIAALVMCVLCCTGKSTSVADALNKNPEIVVQAMQQYETNMRADAESKAQALIADNLEEINNYAGSAVLGNPKAENTIVEFFDFNCGYCHKLYPVLQNVLAKNDNVRLVLKELTFVSPLSSYAAKAALAANEQGKYAELYGAMMTYQGSLSEAKVDELAVLAGVDLEKMKADMNSEKVTKTLQANQDLAAKIQVGGVPTLVINGKMVQTLDEAVILEAVSGK